MIGELKDPYSHFDDPEKAARLEEDLEQKFAGVGLSIDDREGRLKVATPMVGSPAYRAGIEAGDVIAKIGNESTAGMSIEKAKSLMRGAPGSPVRLTIERAGHEKPIEFTFNREIIHVDSVCGDTRLANDQWNFMLDGDERIGYLRILTFGQRTEDELLAALQELKKVGAKGLIIDLRDNPGGLLPTAQGVCEPFLTPGQTIVTIRGRNGTAERKMTANGGEKFSDVPVAVLVNHQSASASEIVAACLQDHLRAVVIGERTYGKGTVQNIIPLDKQIGKLTLTTAKFVRPSEKPIHRRYDADESMPWGVSPDKDYEVKMSKEELDKWRTWRRERDIVRPHQKGTVNEDAASDKETDSNGGAEENANRWEDDPQLRRAVEYIESKIEAGGGKSAVAA
jgi:carboxyl-terminal processing protease